MYKFKSLGTQTNFFLDKVLSNVSEHDKYFVIKTPKRPEYFWGNYILMKNPPLKDDYKNWINIFESEIGKRIDLGYCAITFYMESTDIPFIEEFKQNDFKIEVNKILEASTVKGTQRLNSNLLIKEYDLSKNIEPYQDVHHDSNWEYGIPQSQKD